MFRAARMGAGVCSSTWQQTTRSKVSRPRAEATAWGEARRLVPPVAIEGAPMRWDSPAVDLGSAEPVWAAS